MTMQQYEERVKRLREALEFLLRNKGVIERDKPGYSTAWEAAIMVAEEALAETAEPIAPPWSKEPPTQPGWYWTSDGYSVDATRVLEDELAFWGAEDLAWLPITVPEPPKE